MNVDTSDVGDLIFYAPERIVLGPREFAVSKVVKGKEKLKYGEYQMTNHFYLNHG